MTARWFLRASTAQRSSEREVMTRVKPSSLVVFVQGRRKLAEEKPLGSCRKVTLERYERTKRTELDNTHVAERET